MSKRSEYIESMKTKLDEWNTEIDNLEAKAKVVQSDLKHEYSAMLEALKKQRDEAKAKLKSLESAGDEAWEDIKDGVETAWTSLSSALNSAMSRFK